MKVFSVLDTGLLSLLLFIPCSDEYHTNTDFSRVLRESVENKSPFVDKTMMISDFISNPSKYIIITRPPKWGKSFNMNMLHQFLQIEVDDQGNETADDLKIYKPVFREGNIKVRGRGDAKYPRLKIADDTSLLANDQGTWPVLKLDFSEMEIPDNFRGTEDRFSEFIKNTLARDYKYLTYLINFRPSRLNLKDDERDILLKFLNGDGKWDYLNFIYVVTTALYNMFDGTPVYVLIDHYDIVVNRLIVDRYHPYHDSLRFFEDMYARFLNADLEYKLKKVLMTGIFPYMRKDTYGKLDAFFLCSMTDNTFSEYYGFTKTETEMLINATLGLENRKSILNNIINQYDGYQIMGARRMNPWSILRCLYRQGVIDDDLEYKGYPLYSKISNAIVNDKLKNEIELMLFENETISFTASNEAFGYHDFGHTKTLFLMLLHVGLLTVSRDFIDETSTHVLRYGIPNRVARGIFYREKLHYEMWNLKFDHKNPPFGSENPMVHLSVGNVTRFGKKFRMVLKERCESERIRSEEQLFWLMEALLPPLYDRYRVDWKKNSPFGGTYWRLVPLNRSDCARIPVVILQLKFVKVGACAGEYVVNLKLVPACYKAIKQIIKKNYIDGIEIANRSIYYVGLAVSSSKESKVLFACPKRLSNGTLFAEKFTVPGEFKRRPINVPKNRLF